MGVSIGGAGDGGALEVDGIRLGVGFADGSEVRPKGEIGGDCVDLGTNVGALILSASVVETVVSRLGSAAFTRKPLTGSDTVVSVDTGSRSKGAFDGGEGGLDFVISNRGVEPMVDGSVDGGNVVDEVVEGEAALGGVATNALDVAELNGLGACDDTGKGCCPNPFAIEGAVDDDEGSDEGPPTRVVVLNAEVEEVVENVPKGDAVPKTFGDVERVEKAEVDFGKEEEIGCEPKLDGGHWVASGVNDTGPEDMPSSGSCSSSSMYSAALSSWSSAIPSTVETPSMISEILKPPRIASMSSMASLPNNRSKMHATK